MKNRLMPLLDRSVLRKLTVIESVADRLKHLSRIEHSRYRSVANRFVNLFAGLVAYTWREKQPGLNIRLRERLQFAFRFAHVELACQ